MSTFITIVNDPLDTTDSSKLFKYVVSEYADLAALTDVQEGDIAWIQITTGAFNPFTTTKLKGAWQFLGGVWEYGGEDLQNEIASNFAAIESNNQDILDLQNDKTEKGGYAGTSQDLENAINAIDGSETIVTQGTNTTVTGTGTAADPYIISSTGSPAITKEHRHIYFASRNTIDTIIAATGTPTKVLGTSTQGFGTSGLTMSTNGRITNTSSSTLRVEVKAEISCDKEQGGGKDNFTFYIAQTGAVLIGSKSTTEGGNNDDNTASPSWIGDLAVGQYFEVYVSNIDNPNNLKVSDLSLIVKEL